MYQFRRKSDKRSSLLHRYSEQLGRTVQQNRADLAMVQGAKLKRADALMRNVVENSFDGILTIRSDGGIEMANEAALQAFGYGRDELIDSHVSRLLPELVAQDGDLGDLFQMGRGHREVAGLRRDGSSFSMELAISDMRLDGENDRFRTDVSGGRYRFESAAGRP